MSTVRFAQICDTCGRRSDEYSRWNDCVVCGGDVCTACDMEGNRDEERASTMCRECFAEGSRMADAEQIIPGSLSLLELPNGKVLVTGSRWRTGITIPHIPEGVLISEHSCRAAAIAAIAKAEAK